MSVSSLKYVWIVPDYPSNSILKIYYTISKSALTFHPAITYITMTKNENYTYEKTDNVFVQKH